MLPTLRDERCGVNESNRRMGFGCMNIMNRNTEMKERKKTEAAEKRLYKTRKYSEETCIAFCLLL